MFILLIVCKDAKNWFDEDRVNWITDRYSKPEIKFYESPVVVDNEKKQILSWNIISMNIFYLDEDPKYGKVLISWGTVNQAMQWYLEIYQMTVTVSKFLKINAWSKMS